MGFIQVNLIKKGRGTVKDECFLMMRIITKDIEKMINLTEKEDIFIIRMNIT